MNFYLTIWLTLLFFSFFILYSPNPFKSSISRQWQGLVPLPKGQEKCDLFSGHWVPDLRGPQYTNSSCSTIPDSKNCFKHGRQDADFLHWRWKPDGCELPRFDPKTFFTIVRGKTMAFVGDSVARNHAESLLCLLSLEEMPMGIFKDSEDRFRTWYFPNNKFTLMVLWSRFLVADEERVINGTGSGTFDLHLDKIDRGWANKLPRIDYAIISGVHWFNRKNYLYRRGKLVGCIYCNEPNIPSFNIDSALQGVLRLVFKYINDCKGCKNVVTLIRTYSPSHFENGSWNTGGNCNRTRPLGKEEVKLLESSVWKLRSTQVGEVERAKKLQKRGKRFEVLDITMAMLMRPDGHPDSHWDNKWMRGFNDCVHWCMPGPIDAWNDLMMALIRKFTKIT